MKDLSVVCHSEKDFVEFLCKVLRHLHQDWDRVKRIDWEDNNQIFWLITNSQFSWYVSEGKTVFFANGSELTLQVPPDSELHQKLAQHYIDFMHPVLLFKEYSQALKDCEEWSNPT